MRIITFGSCLARITGFYLAKIYGGEVISSVYHNRSDAFLGRFIEGTWRQHADEAVNDALTRAIETENKPEEARALILRDQCFPWVGLHQLPEGKTVFEALRTAPDLIVVDNEIDLRFMVPTPAPGAPAPPATPPLIATLSPIPAQRSSLSVTQAVETMTRLFAWFRTQAPEAVIVFLNFPHTGYANKPSRAACTVEFEARFHDEQAFIVPCLEASLAKDNRHFTPEHYMLYVEMIAEHLRQIGKGELVPDGSQAAPDPQREELAKLKRALAALYGAENYAAVVALGRAGAGDWDVGMLYALGISLWRTGDRSAALATFSRLSEMDPPVQAGLERAIVLARDLRRVSELTKLLEKHARFFPAGEAFRVQNTLKNSPPKS